MTSADIFLCCCCNQLLDRCLTGGFCLTVSGLQTCDQTEPIRNPPLAYIQCCAPSSGRFYPNAPHQTPFVLLPSLSRKSLERLDIATPLMQNASNILQNDAKYKYIITSKSAWNCKCNVHPCAKHQTTQTLPGSHGFSKLQLI